MATKRMVLAHKKRERHMKKRREARIRWGNQMVTLKAEQKAKWLGFVKLMTYFKTLGAKNVTAQE